MYWKELNEDLAELFQKRSHIKCISEKKKKKTRKKNNK